MNNEMTNNFFSTVVFGLRNTIQKLPNDFLTIAGWLIFISVFINGILPNNILPLDSNSKGELNKIIVGAYIPLNVYFVTSYISAITKRTKKSEVIPRPEAQQGDLEYLYGIDYALNRNELRRERDKSLISQKAFIGLIQGMAEPPSSSCALMRAIRKVSTDALSLRRIYNKDGTDHPEMQSVSTLLFYKCMVAYISAWLICSIKHSRNIEDNNGLSIDSIFYQDPTRKEKYITAINLLIDEFDSDTLKSGLFKNDEEAVKLVQNYLRELVEIIRKKSETLPKNFSSSKITPTTNF